MRVDSLGGCILHMQVHPGASGRLLAHNPVRQVEREREISRHKTTKPPDYQPSGFPVETIVSRMQLSCATFRPKSIMWNGDLGNWASIKLSRAWNRAPSMGDPQIISRPFRERAHAPIPRDAASLVRGTIRSGALPWSGNPHSWMRQPAGISKV